MKRWLHGCAVTTGVLCLLSLGDGCSNKRNQAVPPPETDLRKMIVEARNRQLRSVRLDTLQQALQTFQTRMGRSPTNLEEIVRLRFLKEIPPAPEGMIYSLDPQYGNVQLVPLSPAKMTMPKPIPPRP